MRELNVNEIEEVNGGFVASVAWLAYGAYRAYKAYSAVRALAGGFTAAAALGASGE